MSLLILRKGFFGGFLKPSSVANVSQIDMKHGDDDPSSPAGHVELRGSMPTDAELPAEIHVELPATEISPPPKYGFVDNKDGGNEGARRAEERTQASLVHRLERTSRTTWGSMDSGVLRGNLNLSIRRSGTTMSEARRHVLSFMEYKEEGS
jgi:hypothetical protein